MAAVQVNARSLLFSAKDVYSPIGPEDERVISATTIPDLESLHAQLFQPEHATLGVSGDVTSERLQAAAARAFAGWKQTRPALPRSTRASEAASPGAKAVLVDHRGVLVHGYVVARGPSAGDLDSDAMTLLAAVLRSRKGRLHEEVRSQIGAAYAFSSELHVLRGASWLAVGGAFDLNRAVAALTAVARAVRTLRDQGVPAADLEGARSGLIASFREDAATTDGVTQMLASAVAQGTPPSDVLSRQERLTRLTGADVVRAARTWLSEERLRLVVVGPAKIIETGFETIGIGPLEWRTARGVTRK